MMPSVKHSFRQSLRMARQCFAVVTCFACFGCTQQDSGPSVVELNRRLKQRQKETLADVNNPQERLELAQSLFADGNISGAETQLRPILIARPNDPKANLLAAKCAAAKGQTLVAVTMLDAIDQSDTSAYAMALWLSGQWLTDAKQYDAAEQKLKDLLQFQGDSNRVHRRLATLMNNQGRRMEAAVHLRALARRGDVSEKELFAMNAYSEAFIDESMPKPDFGADLVPAALVFARQLRSDGNLPKAAILVERLAESFPASTQVSAFQGRIYTELLSDEKIQQWASKTPVGIEREPEYWSALGSWAQRHGRHREAVRCFGEAVNLDETDRQSYLGLARSLTVLEDLDSAQQANDRFQLLDESAGIARKLGLAPGTIEQLNRMAEINDQLRRPWEAIAWRSVALATHGSSAAESDALRSEREALSMQATPTVDKRFQTCGIKLADWPLPVIENTDANTVDEPINRAGITPILLQNVAAGVGLEFQYDNGDDPSDDSRLLHQLTGGGIGVVDFDLDGFADLYFSQGGGDAFNSTGSKPNQLFRNLSGKRFVDITALAQVGDLGYGQGVAVADLNQDGFADIAVANIGPNILYLNNGDGTFNRRVLSSPIGDGGWTTSIACGDLSGDQLPEIVEINYIDDPSALTIACTPKHDICNPSVFRPAADCVWSVATDGKMVPWIGCQEIAAKPNYGFAAVIANFDAKAGNDLFIANDTGINHFWVSRKTHDGSEFSLTESAQVLGCDTGVLGQRQGSMGIASGDFDRNACLDLYVTNFWNQPPDLYLQQTTGLFINASSKYGLYEPGSQTVAWGAQASDFDRNGWLDFAVLNGHLADHRHLGEPFEMRPQLFRGDRDGFHSVEPSGTGHDYWATATLGRTMAVLDWNSDRKPDLIANHLDVPVALLENRTDVASSIQLELVGVISERDAIGATVTVSCGDQSWVGWVTGGDGFLCSNEQVIDIGIGTQEWVDRIDVHWPSGKSQRFTELAANHRYLLVEGDDDAFGRE